MAVKRSLFIILLIATFFYSYNLRATLPFDGDTARDTLAMLQIWQNKTITLLGAPLSLGFGTTKEVYFSSLANYLGLVGLVVAKFNPIGASLPNLFFMLLSIPIFWFWISRLTHNYLTSFIATFIYALNPLTVNQARFFWNPNLLIPFSVFFWYFISLKRYFLAGVFIGIMFHFHYLGILAGIVVAFYLLFQKKWRSFFELFSWRYFSHLSFNYF